MALIYYTHAQTGRPPDGSHGPWRAGILSPTPEEKTPLYVIVPVFNEERTVYTLLGKVCRTDVSAYGYDVRIIVVDDGSNDGTPREIDRFLANSRDAPITRIRYDVNRGKGAAIREALKECPAENGIVLIQDADLEYDPADYPVLLAPIREGKASVVYGSRRRNSGIGNWSGWLYALGGWLENVYLRLLYRTNVTDIATGYKIMPLALLKSLALRCEGFEFCPEVTAKLLNRRVEIREVPISYHSRKKRDGKKIRWTDFFIALWILARVRIRNE